MTLNNIPENKQKVFTIISELETNKELVFEKVYSCLFDIVFICDEGYTIVDVSPSLTRELGYTEDVVKGSSIFALSNDNESLQLVFDNLSNGEKHVYEVPLVSADNKKIWYDFFATSVMINGYNLLVVIASNITDRRNTTEKIRQHSIDIERQLEQKNKYLAQQNKFSLQRNLTLWLIVLIAGIILLTPFLSWYAGASENYINSTQQMVLLLINGLLLIVNSQFSDKQSKDG